MKKEAIVVGWINTGKPADCGETMKNQLMIQKLESFGVRCHQVDFKNWRKHPWVFFKLAFLMLFHRSYVLIFSTSTVNVYPMMKLMKKFKWKQPSIHWVIGGNLGNQVINGMYAADVIDYIGLTIVESPIMNEQLAQCGVKNVKVLPNFKPIPYFPNIDNRLATLKSRSLKFVFLSRIMCEKGCDYILESARILNDEGFEKEYSIDFYGKVADSFKDVFTAKLSSLSNVQYEGFLNLRDNAGYDKLAEYDVMLFPTYWNGEGFAGIFMDAFICGLPLIATDWAHNRQFMQDGKTAMFIPVHDVVALKECMRKCIERKYDLVEMAKNCQRNAKLYDVDNVLTPQTMKEMGLWQE
ncbi:glycosyltransferase family 4 protein [Fibrobacter sp.]|uniref:glycosyltransferase family 4 protein n=1 Tax=Fibrobacter sp. TaxID=35828 RepID=UPI00388E8125